MRWYSEGDFMPTITVPEATYQRLSRRAAALSTSVEALAQPALERVAREPEANRPPLDPPGQMAHEEWKKGMDEWQAIVESRADRYPPGHVTDCSRESIYEGCGE